LILDVIQHKHKVSTSDAPSNGNHPDKTELTPQTRPGSCNSSGTIARAYLQTALSKELNEKLHTDSWGFQFVASQL